MYDISRDLIGTCPTSEGVEVEFRFPIYPSLFDTVHEQFVGTGEAAAPIRSTVMYSETCDQRCVDGLWQRKRAVARRRISCGIRCNLVVSVESPTAPPAPPALSGFITSERCRWSYVRGSWRVDFTRSDRVCNVEIEYSGPIAALIDSARGKSDMCGLPVVMDSMLARLSFSYVGTARDCLPRTRDMPFVRMDLSRCLVGQDERRALVLVMQRNQPVSITTKALPFKCPLVSLKYDGVRVAVSIMRYRDTWVAVGVCRRGQPWWVPCLTARCEMTLDCEYIHSARTFVIFDLLAVNRTPLRANYRQRLSDLAQLSLPVLAGLTMSVKTIYPFCALTPTWYSDRSEDELRVDGIILHEGASTLDRPSQMFKWKPEHTVDLYVGNHGILMDGSFTPFLKSEPGSTAKCKGEIWECIIVGDCARPQRLRTDKNRANARHVCRDILRAHRESLNLADVIRILGTRRDPVRVSKRKRIAT